MYLSLHSSVAEQFRAMTDAIFFFFFFAKSEHIQYSLHVVKNPQEAIAEAGRANELPSSSLLP